MKHSIRESTAGEVKAHKRLATSGEVPGAWDGGAEEGNAERQEEVGEAMAKEAGKVNPVFENPCGVIGSDRRR